MHANGYVWNNGKPKPKQESLCPVHFNVHFTPIHLTGKNWLSWPKGQTKQPEEWRHRGSRKAQSEVYPRVSVLTHETRAIVETRQKRAGGRLQQWRAWILLTNTNNGSALLFFQDISLRNKQCFVENYLVPIQLIYS